MSDLLAGLATVAAMATWALGGVAAVNATNTRRHIMQARQGDVFIERIAALPEGVQPKATDQGRVILAYGEVTGHAHALDATLADLFEDRAGVLYLRVGPGGAAVQHEEHGAIALDPGVYRVTHQREYSPEAIRRVAD